MSVPRAGLMYSDCYQIDGSAYCFGGRLIRRKYLADPTACPWCGGAIQADIAPEVNEGVVPQGFGRRLRRL